MILDLWIFGWLVTAIMMVTSTLAKGKNPFINGFWDGVMTVIIAVTIWPVVLIGVVEFFRSDMADELSRQAKGVQE